MKRILITGANSYIGESVKTWLEKWPDKYMVSTIDMLDDKWKECDFGLFDCVYHVAGIAHRNDAPDELYERVNHLLAVEVAEKAVKSGVGQFILMSSGAVYSQNDKKHKSLEVNENSHLDPSTAYGISKMKAEKDISNIARNSNTRIVILRPPTVYGYKAKGNYNSLSKIANSFPIFPKIKNVRSMIYIDNLCEFIRMTIDDESEGVFLPQNRDYVSTYEMVNLIAQVHSRKILCISVFNWAIYLASHFSDKINKAFGSYIYLKKNNKDYFDGQYQIVDFKTSIQRSEGK